MPEVMILDACFRGAADKFVPVFFDEAGHRVATQCGSPILILIALNFRITSYAPCPVAYVMWPA